jgi:hypothetical protein
MNELTGAAEQPDPHHAGAPGLSRNEDRETLLSFIRGHRWSEASETLNRLLPAAEDETEKQKLRLIQEKIYALDFDQAEQLLLGEQEE